MPPPRSSEQPAHDLLRQCEPERDEIHALVDRRGGATGSKISTRTMLPCETFAVQIEQLGGSIASFRVWPRDISGTGIGFVHGAFVHTGVRCTLLLPALDKRIVNVPGVVARCEYIKGRAHFVGVRFDESLGLHEFVPGIAPPADATDKGKKKSTTGEPIRDLKTLVAELVALSGHKDCPPQMRKIIRQIGEQVAK